MTLYIPGSDYERLLPRSAVRNTGKEKEAIREACAWWVVTLLLLLLVFAKFRVQEMI